MVRLARGTTEIEGLELDEGRILFDATFHRRPTSRDAYLLTPDEDARPEHAYARPTEVTGRFQCRLCSFRVLLCRIHPLTRITD